MSQNSNYSSQSTDITKIYVGGLVDDVGNDKLQKLFSKFGPIRKVWVARNPGSKGYAFIDFNGREAAEEAIKEMHGKRFMGASLRVQFSKNDLAYNPAISKKRKSLDDHSTGHSTEKHIHLKKEVNDRKLDIDILDKSMIHGIRTPALETLIHLERLARIRLERECLETYNKRLSTSSTDSSFHRDMTFQTSLRSTFSSVVGNLLQEPELSDNDILAPSNSSYGSSVSSRSQPRRRSDSHNKCHYTTQKITADFTDDRGYNTCLENDKNASDTTENHYHTQNSQYIASKSTGDRFHPYNNAKSGRYTDASSRNTSNHSMLSSQPHCTNFDSNIKPCHNQYQQNSSPTDRKDWYGKKFYGFSFLPNMDYGGGRNDSQTISQPSTSSYNQTTPKYMQKTIGSHQYSN